jgi:hypothetical protein
VKKLPAECHDVADAYLTTLDKDYLPPWRDARAVLHLFCNEEMREWSAEWPWFEAEPNPREAAIKKAEGGDPSDLIRLVMRRPGRPKGVPMPKARKVARWPIHRAASMVPMAEYILGDLYPDQPKNQIRDRALIVVKYLCKGSVTENQLENYLKRSKTNRRRV